MTNTEIKQICDDIVLNPKFNTQLFNVGLQILFFQSNDKFQDKRLFWFECRQNQGTYLPQSTQTSCDAQPSPVRWVTQTSSPGLQGLRQKYDHSPPLSAEGKLSSTLHHGVYKTEF
jgi:hypothetical protein